MTEGNHHRRTYHDNEREELPEARLAVFWVGGALSILAGTWIAGHLEWVLGTSLASYYGALLVAFLLILFGGLAWIGVAVSVAHNR